MVTERNFSSVFDYSSAFDYSSPSVNMKPLKQNYKSAFTYHSIPIAEDDFENNFKETWPFVILRNGITVILYFFAVLFFPISIFICLKKVHALERVVLMRLGKLQPIRGPELKTSQLKLSAKSLPDSSRLNPLVHFSYSFYKTEMRFAVILPCIDKWTRVDLRPKHFTISASQSLTADGGVIEAKSDIEYRVSDVINYVMKLRQQESTLRDLSLFCLGNIISEKDLEDLELKREIINCNFKNELNRSAINWGLEIISANLHSVKILKAAEPVDAIGTIMTALKAATGQSTQHSVVNLPTIPNKSENAVAFEDFNRDEVSNESDSKQNTDDIVIMIRKLTDDVSKERKLDDLSAKFCLDITGQPTRKLFIYCEKGIVSVFEDPNNITVCDVYLKLAEDVLKGFLGGKISPLDAYMDGKVTVDGDWRMLKSLSRIFH